jgi:hypothetical protein
MSPAASARRSVVSLCLCTLGRLRSARLPLATIRPRGATTIGLSRSPLHRLVFPHCDQPVSTARATAPCQQHRASLDSRLGHDGAARTAELAGVRNAEPSTIHEATPVEANTRDMTPLMNFLFNRTCLIMDLRLPFSAKTLHRPCPPHVRRVGCDWRAQASHGHSWPDEESPAETQS